MTFLCITMAFCWHFQHAKCWNSAPPEKVIFHFLNYQTKLELFYPAKFQTDCIDWGYSPMKDWLHCSELTVWACQTRPVVTQATAFTIIRFVWGANVFQVYKSLYISCIVYMLLGAVSRCLIHEDRASVSHTHFPLLYSLRVVSDKM